LQRARRGTIPVADTLAAGEQIARQKGADLVSTWKPGKAFNAEELTAVKAYAGGLNQKISELQADTNNSFNANTQKDLLNLHEQLFSATAAMVGTKSEAGRAMRSLRESIAPVEYDPVTGHPIRKPVSNAKEVTTDDRANAVEFLTKVYGDKPVPQSVIDELSQIPKSDPQRFIKLLQRQTHINNKTSLGDALANTVRAGMLTSLRTLERNFGGLAANAGLRDGDSRIASVL